MKCEVTRDIPSKVGYTVLHLLNKSLHPALYSHSPDLFTFTAEMASLVEL